MNVEQRCVIFKSGMSIDFYFVSSLNLFLFQLLASWWPLDPGTWVTVVLGQQSDGSLQVTRVHSFPTSCWTTSRGHSVILTFVTRQDSTLWMWKQCTEWTLVKVQLHFSTFLASCQLPLQNAHCSLLGAIFRLRASPSEKEQHDARASR